MQIKLLLCPRSGKPIIKPVVLNHRELLPLIYDEQSVIAALKEGELKAFDITAEILIAI